MSEPRETYTTEELLKAQAAFQKFDGVSGQHFKTHDMSSGHDCGREIRKEMTLCMAEIMFGPLSVQA